MNRRNFLKTIGVSGGLLALAKLTEAKQYPEKQTNQPNIVMFLVDDMGWQDTSVAFHTKTTPFNHRYHTPNMEQLAREGMKFTQAYSCCVCSPTRVSLMTGLNTARHRVTNWTLRKNASNDAGDKKLQFPAWNVNGLSPVPGIERTVYAQTLPQLLREVGYRTIHVGKAHFGAIGTPGEDPLKLGFDVNIAGHAAGGPGSFLGIQNFSAAWRKGDRVWDVPGLEKYHGKDVFLTEALTIEANKAMDDSIEQSKPFYLYMSHYAVHVPFAEDSRFIRKYLEAGLDPKEAMYAAMIEGMDKSLGDIMANIKRHHIEDNTIILFMSDNGGLSANGRGGKRHTHNKPLSSGKGSSHEGGVRVPMIVKWLGVTEPGSICDDYVIIEDYFPTILEIAGIKEYRQIGGRIDGVSFVSLLKGKSFNQKKRSLIWHFPNKWGPTGPGIGPYSAIRNGDWKLIYYYSTQKYELFNIKEDISETNNLYNAKPNIAKQLAVELRRFLTEANAQMPIDKHTGKSVPLPG
jgi:arylsulfatase A-like enzyme